MSDSGKGQIEGAWINDTLRAVTALTDNGDEQLSILARALVVGCKSCGVDKDRTVEIVTALFDEQTTLVPFVNLRPEAEAARAEERWQSIETLPPNPVQVEFFYSKLMMHDQNGNPVSPIIEPYRDERRQLGYFDGDVWCHCGTGHRVFEFHDTPLEDLPTHWRALPEPPRKAQPVALGEGEG